MLLALFKMIRPVNIVIAMVTLSIGYYLLGVLPLQEIGTFVEIARCETVDISEAVYVENISWLTLILQALGFAFAIGFANMAAQEVNWPVCRAAMADYLQNSFLVMDEEE